MNNCYYHFVGWRNDQNKSCRSWCVLHLCYLWLFHLKSFTVLTFCLKFSNFEIQILSCSNKVIWRNDQNKCCTYQWGIQLSCWWIFHLKSVLIPKLFWKFSYYEIQILNHQMNSNGERTNTKVLYLNDSYNFCFNDFFINNIFIMIYILKWNIFMLVKEKRKTLYTKLGLEMTLEFSPTPTCFVSGHWIKARTADTHSSSYKTSETLASSSHTIPLLPSLALCVSSSSQALSHSLTNLSLHRRWTWFGKEARHAAVGDADPALGARPPRNHGGVDPRRRLPQIRGGVDPAVDDADPAFGAVDHVPRRRRSRLPWCGRTSMEARPHGAGPSCARGAGATALTSATATSSYSRREAGPPPLTSPLRPLLGEVSSPFFSSH